MVEISRTNRCREPVRGHHPFRVRCAVEICQSGIPLRRRRCKRQIDPFRLFGVTISPTEPVFPFGGFASVPQLTSRTPRIAYP